MLIIIRVDSNLMPVLGNTSLSDYRSIHTSITPANQGIAMLGIINHKRIAGRIQIDKQAKIANKKTTIDINKTISDDL